MKPVHAHLQRYEERDGLYTEVSPVNIVAHEEVVGVGHVPTNAEELKEVVELAVHIATDGDRAVDLPNIALAGQNLFGFCAQRLDFCFRQRFALPQAFNLRVQIAVGRHSPCKKPKKPKKHEQKKKQTMDDE
jgi:hypothetical protein